MANTPAARRALDAYRALQRRATQVDAAPQYSFEARTTRGDRWLVLNCASASDSGGVVLMRPA